jgi:hypothetical protein
MNIVEKNDANSMLFRLKYALCRAKKSVDVYHTRSLAGGEFAGVASETFKEISDNLEQQISKIPGPCID